MPPKAKLQAFRGPLPERFLSIMWTEANRLAHEAKRPFPSFSVALHLDWSRVMKRRDIEHPGPPDRFQAIVGHDLGDAIAVYFVVYAKANRQLRMISIRFANENVREVFFNPDFPDERYCSCTNRRNSP